MRRFQTPRDRRRRDGYRESTESWAGLLRDLKRRGMRAPALAIGDGALGFWKALRDVWPEMRKAAKQAIARFEADYGAKYPKAIASLRRDEKELLTFFDFPAEHWIHLRTGNVIESPFATVRLRQRVTKGAGSRQKGILMAFQLLAMAERRWRRINAPQLVPLVRAGGVFRDGATVQRRARVRAA